jgi:hypothetical protein
MWFHVYSWSQHPQLVGQLAAAFVATDVEHH